VKPALVNSGVVELAVVARPEVLAMSPATGFDELEKRPRSSASRRTSLTSGGVIAAIVTAAPDLRAPRASARVESMSSPWEDQPAR
jgi:hypothetical protein